MYQLWSIDFLGFNKIGCDWSRGLIFVDWRNPSQEFDYPLPKEYTPRSLCMYRTQRPTYEKSEALFLLASLPYLLHVNKKKKLCS